MSWKPKRGQRNQQSQSHNVEQKEVSSLLFPLKKKSNFLKNKLLGGKKNLLKKKHYKSKLWEQIAKKSVIFELDPKDICVYFSNSCS